MNENCFVKQNDSYILSKSFTKSTLKKNLEICISQNIKDIIMSSSKTYDKYILIGSCYPKDNLILSFKTNSYFPKKLEELLEKKPTLKWILKEHDIKIDIDAMNSILVEIFNEMFTKEKKIKIMLGEDYDNLIMVSHRRLDCYALFKTIKWAYGSSNCVNIYKEKLSNKKQCLIALNELISKYIPNKIAMNHSYEFKTYAIEVKNYLDKKIGM